MKTLWVNFITKQYKKYYPDPIDDMFKKLDNKKFRGKAEAFDFLLKNSERPLKSLMIFINDKIERRIENAGNKCSRNKKTII